jgi:hypothetical protein
MSDSSETKICPLCAETIKAVAKICPFCQMRLDGRGRWQNQPALIISVLTLLAIFIFGAWLFVELRCYARDFARHRGELLVVRTSLERSPEKSELWLSGYVTNLGEHAWRVRELEVRFVNAHSNLLDASHPDLKDGFAVQPHHESAFHVELGRLSITNGAIARQVRVEAATDDERIFGSEPD